MDFHIKHEIKKWRNNNILKQQSYLLGTVKIFP